MYDMYPDWTGTEWGPAKHDPQHPFRALGAADVAFAQRDADDQRPDDN